VRRCNTHTVRLPCVGRNDESCKKKP
jgi:hypothetical protein